MIKLMMLTRKKYHITLKKGFLYHSVSALSLSLSALSLSLSLSLAPFAYYQMLKRLHPRPITLLPYAHYTWSMVPRTAPLRVLWTYFLSVHDTQSIIVYIIGSDPVQRYCEILRPSSCLIEPARVYSVYYWIKMLSPVSSKSIASYLQRQCSSSFHQLKASPKDL